MECLKWFSYINLVADAFYVYHRNVCIHFDLNGWYRGALVQTLHNYSQDNL